MYYRGELTYFSSSKTKELLAIFVDWSRREVMLSHLAEILNEGERDETAAKQIVHLAWYRLKQTLKKYGIEKIMVKGRGTYTTNEEAVICNSCDMVRQVQGASNFFTGEYIPEYSRTEVTLSNLIRDYFEGGEL